MEEWSHLLSCCAHHRAKKDWQSALKDALLTAQSDQTWRALDRAYVDKTFNGQSWFKVSVLCEM